MVFEHHGQSGVFCYCRTQEQQPALPSLVLSLDAESTLTGHVI